MKFYLRMFAGLCLSVTVIGAAHAKDMVLQVATQDQPHVRALLDGRVKTQGCKLHLTTATAEALSQDLAGAKQYDILEVDLVPFLGKFSAGELKDYVLIPVFLSRGFQLRNIYIRTDRGIHVPADLRGKTVGVSERALSASVWVRGVLHSSWNVKPGDMIVSELPAASAALQQGKLDAAFSTVPPSTLGDTGTLVARLFKDYYTAESELFKTSRIFPILTALAVKKSIADENPWLPESVFLAFSEAKKKAMDNLTLPMPWDGSHLQDTETLMGKNFWSYGVKSNPKTLGALFHYLEEQGALKHSVKIDDVFAPSTLMLLED